MDTPNLRHTLLVLASVLTLTFSGLVAAEPPSRAARLGYISGTVSFSPAGQPDWVRAVVNRPLTTGDRLWADTNSRAEVQVGGAAIRMGARTSMTLLNLDDRIAQVQLSQGTLKLRVRNIGRNQAIEVDTPNLAFTLRRAGEYRISVDPNDDATVVMVQSGAAEVYGEGASYAVNSRQGYRFYGTGLSDYEPLAMRREDELDRWARSRDRLGSNSRSARYVSPDVVGYEDLDSNGTWRADRTYGNVWTPTRVAAGWTPYRDGHWAWVDPWGWTWVDDAPWGYAVSHYGRWANIDGTWSWVPGPPRERAVYAPALVAFVGGKNFQISASIGSAVAAAVGWFPLAPREVYQPSYPVSRTYFDRVNRSNAVLAPATITNVYNTTIVNNTTNVTQVIYANQQVTGAVVAVPVQAFAQSQPVAKAVVPLSKEKAVSAPVARVATVAPVQQSVQGGAANASSKPPVHQQAIVARTAPPPPPVAFAAQQTQLAANPGKPIDETQRTQLKPTAPSASQPKVSVVTAQAPAPIAVPPAIPPAGKSPDARKAEAARAEVVKADGAKAGASKAEAPAAKTEAARIETAKAAPGRIEPSKPEAPVGAGATTASVPAAVTKAEAAKADVAKAEAAKTDAARAGAAKADAARAEGVRADAEKANAAKAATAKVQATKAEEVSAEAAKAEAKKADAAKAASERADAAKADATKAEAARAEGARGDAMKAEAAKVATAKAEASRAEAAKAEAVRAEGARGDAMKAEAAKAAAAKAEASKAEAAKTEAVRAEGARGDAMKAEAAKAAAARSEAAKAQAAKAEAARAEAARDASAKAEASKVAAVKAEAALSASTRASAAAPRPPARKAEPAGKAEAESRKADDKKADDDARKR